MGSTQVRGKQLKDGDIGREDLNVDTSGRSVVRKIIGGTNVNLTATGVDAGTGDVTINVPSMNDGYAIHDNVAGEINALSSVTPLDDDIVVIEDHSNSWNKKKVSVENLRNDFIGCLAYTETDLVCAHATWVSATFDLEKFDTYPSGLSEMHSVSSNKDRIYARVTGAYLIKAYGKFVANGTGYRGIRININTTTEVIRDFRLNNSGTYLTDMHVSHIYYMTAGQYVTVEFWQSSGGNLSVVSSWSQVPYLSLIKL